MIRELYFRSMYQNIFIKVNMEENLNINLEKNSDEMPTCGLVMPISKIDGLEPEHWLEVLGILREVATTAGFRSDLVSASEFAGVIQSRIVQNLYQNEIVIVDVSAKNPNVMFELGLRLAFDKATIVIIDDETDISFDTGPIEHIIYPRDLRHGKIVAFKDQLKKKLLATYKKSQDPEYSTFLKHFGTFDVKGLKEIDGNFNDLVVARLDQMSKQISILSSTNSFIKTNLNVPDSSVIEDLDKAIKEAYTINESLIGYDDVTGFIQENFRNHMKDASVNLPRSFVKNRILNFLHEHTKISGS